MSWQVVVTMSKASRPLEIPTPRDRDDDAGAERYASWQPALVKLSLDVREIRQQLLDGFGSRRDLLAWEQRLAVRTLGELPQRFYKEVARGYRSDVESSLLASLLEPGAREVSVSSEAAQETRERLAAEVVGPAFHRAFRRLRVDATEYVDDGDGHEMPAEHDPGRQQHTAMRPSLDELDEYQSRALSSALAGFADTTEILEWGDLLELATYGEVGERFLSRCYREKETRRMLMSGNSHPPSAREAFCAHYVLPLFNRGVRELAAHAGERPSAEREETEVSQL